MHCTRLYSNTNKEGVVKRGWAEILDNMDTDITRYMQQNIVYISYQHHICNLGVITDPYVTSRLQRCST